MQIYCLDSATSLARHGGLALSAGPGCDLRYPGLEPEFAIKSANCGGQASPGSHTADQTGVVNLTQAPPPPLNVLFLRARLGEIFAVLVCQCKIFGTKCDLRPGIFLCSWQETGCGIVALIAAQEVQHSSFYIGALSILRPQLF